MDKYRKRLLENQEKKDKKKARRFAFFFIIISLILLLFPFIIKEVPEEQRMPRAVYVQFEKDFRELADASAKSSTRPERSSEPESEEVENPPADTPEETVEETVPDPVPDPPSEPVEEIRPEVKPIPKAQPLPERNVSITSPEREVAFKKPVPTVPKPSTTKPSTESSQGSKKDYLDDLSKYFPEQGKKPAGDAGTGQKSNDSKAGEGDQGSSDTGVSESDGNAEFGSDGDGFGGEGFLTREVVYRSPTKSLSLEKEGSIAIYVCVDRDGRVMSTKALPALSSIKNSGVLSAAETIVKKNRYKKDYTAEAKECGVYKFKVQPLEN
ncbi:MAG: hypothetical protein HKN16_13545 [Saprospiraceae bacterium]|nr:hypothetical protein [Saprospiraceae bacterium]